MLIEQIQEALLQEKLDGWLFFDHHRRDPLAYRILSLPPLMEPTRRWYYFIPTSGQPRKLVHSIESGALDAVPGVKQSYSRWLDQRAKLGALLAGAKRIAMQYSADCAIPYVSMVDAGTVELVRACGVDVVSSADLVQQFEARWTQAQYESHIEAGKRVDRARSEAFALAHERLDAGVPVTEYDVQQFLLRRFEQLDLVTNHGPIVGVNENASNPHYEPSRDRYSHIQTGDLLLIDLWAKLKQNDAVYYDVTWTAFCGQPIPEKALTVFEIVKDARRRACNLVIERVQSGQELRGFEVDDAARSHIEERGFGEYFFHRTGHSIGTDVHGAGANMDNFESHDDRRIIADTCFSVEPGIYLPEFGIRSEVNVYVGSGFAQVTGEQQDELVQI
jgi:Xaa-Pro aminopeptidase